MTDQPPSRHAEAWELVKTDPEVLAAHAALDELEAEEDRLSRELGRAIRRAQVRAEEHLAACDPWKEPCGRCGRQPAGVSPEGDPAAVAP